jgi:hypothetical protein
MVKPISIAMVKTIIGISKRVLWMMRREIMKRIPKGVIAIMKLSQKGGTFVKTVK